MKQFRKQNVTKIIKIGNIEYLLQGSKSIHPNTNFETMPWKNLANSSKYWTSTPTIQYIIPCAKLQRFTSNNMGCTLISTDIRPDIVKPNLNFKLITKKVYNFVLSLTNSWKCYRRKGKFNLRIRDQASKGNSLIPYITSGKVSVDLKLF